MLSILKQCSQTIDVLNLNGTNLEISLEDDGVATETLNLAPLIAPDTDDWNLTGNTGTNTATNFVGTIDLTALSFRTNNSEKLRISIRGVLEPYNRGGGVAIGQGAAANDNLVAGENVAVGNNTLASVISGATNVKTSHSRYR